MERNDAIIALSAQVPEHCLQFAEQLYVLDFDAAAAAAAVGKPGLARELLQDPRVQRCIATIGGEMREQFRTQRQQAVWQLACMLSFDPKDVWKGRELVNVDQMPPEARMCIEQCEYKPDGTVKIKFARRLEIIRTFLEVFGDIESTNVVGQQGAVKIVFHGRERG